MCLYNRFGCKPFLVLECFCFKDRLDQTFNLKPYAAFINLRKENLKFVPNLIQNM